MKFIISPHTERRTRERISKEVLSLFVKGVAKAQSLQLAGDWAVKVVAGGKVLGYAVGNNRTWNTTLSPGQTPRGRGAVQVVKI